MGKTSPLINNLLESLEQEPVPGSVVNRSTLLRQAQVAERWLFDTYLVAWLELIGGIVDCDYPEAKAHQARLRSVSRLRHRLARDKDSSPAERVFLLASIQSHIRDVLMEMGGCPASRSMQWGVWARDIPTAIAGGFDETGFLNSVVCEGIAPCCMFAAFLVSQVVTDAGVAEEIASRMFDTLPDELLRLLQDVPVAPEA